MAEFYKQVLQKPEYILCKIKINYESLFQGKHGKVKTVAVVRYHLNRQMYRIGC